MRAIPPTTGIAAIPAAPGPRARPARGVPLGSFAELSRQKIVFDLQLADLPVQNINLRLVGGALRHAAALENAGGAIQQLLLPAIDLVRMNPEMTRQLGHRPVAFHRRQRYLRLERRVVPLPCLLHVLLPRYQRSLGAGLHLSQLSHFRGPAHAGAIRATTNNNDIMFTEINPTSNRQTVKTLRQSQRPESMSGSGYLKFRNTRTSTSIWARRTRSSVPTVGRGSASILD